MAYVTVEDDTSAVEMLAFSNVLSQYGGYLRENEPVVITGRLSIREEKEPQIVINRARPMSDFYQNDATFSQPPVNGTLYLKLASEESIVFGKVKAILNMFPGKNPAVVYFADTKLRRGTQCALDARMLEELELLLGKENVVIK